MESDQPQQQAVEAGEGRMGMRSSEVSSGDKAAISLDQLFVGCFRGAAAGVILFGLLALQIMLSDDIKGGDLYFNAFSLQLFIGAGAIAGTFVLRDTSTRKKQDA